MTNQKNLIKILWIIILFFGVVIAPNTNVITKRASGDSQPIEIPNQIWDTTTKTTQTIQLTEQQIPLVRVIFDNLKNQLSCTGSTEETQKIFNDTIIELNRHHLLPEGMTVKQAQRLVNQVCIHPRTASRLQRLAQNLQSQTTDGAIQNSFCSVAGNTSNTHVAKLAKRIALRMYYIIDYNTGNEPLSNLATGLYIIFNEISKINSLFLRQDGRHLGACLYFGNYHYAEYPNWLSPAQGWIQTEGSHGKQNITGSFWGQTMTSGWQPQVDWYMNYSWRGCLGFTGLLYYSGTDNVYFLGSALSVNVGSNRP
jgi:hypothetical protein